MSNPSLPHTPPHERDLHERDLHERDPDGAAAVDAEWPHSRRSTRCTRGTRGTRA